MNIFTGFGLLTDKTCTLTALGQNINQLIKKITGKIIQ